MKNIGEYHDLYAQSDILWLDDLFQNFKNIGIKIYELHSAKFHSTPELARQAALKNTKVKLIFFLTDTDVLLMMEKGIKGGICHSIY